MPISPAYPVCWPDWRTGSISESLRTGARSDIGEIAQSAFLAAMSDELGRSLPSLFDPTPADIRRALGKLSSGDHFASLARSFFAEVVQRTLNYYLSRELSNHVGRGGRFATDAERVAFDRALAQHAHEAARIVEAYAGGWYGKALWQSGGLTTEKARAFTSYAMTKLRQELAAAGRCRLRSPSGWRGGFKPAGRRSLTSQSTEHGCG